MVIMIIVGLMVLIGILIAVINKDSSPNPASAQSESKSGSTVQFSTVPPRAETKKAGSAGVKSLDALYAEKNGLWVCRYCETLNPEGSLSCAACGENR